MSAVGSPKVVAEFAVALLACGAIHYFFIAPAAGRAASIRHQADTIASQSSNGPALTADQLTAMTDRARESARQIAERSSLARDETRLFTSVMSLADSAGVRVDQLQPLEPGPGERNPGAANPTPTPPAPDTPTDRPLGPAAGYTITLSAPFANVVEFMQRMRTDLGFTVIRSVRIAPAGDSAEAGVRAVLTTEHYAFDVSKLERFAAASPDDAPATGGSR